MTELAPLPPLIERALKAVKSTRSLTVLSMNDMHALCQLAVLQHDLIADIRKACELTAAKGGAIEPVSLQNAILNALADITLPHESKAS